MLFVEDSYENPKKLLWLERIRKNSFYIIVSLISIYKTRLKISLFLLKKSEYNSIFLWKYQFYVLIFFYLINNDPKFCKLFFTFYETSEIKKTIS